MFYISRQVRPGVYGVIDTDDGREDFFTLEELDDAVCHQDFYVRGVVTQFNHVTKFREIVTVIPVGTNEEGMAKVAKVALLYGIDIRVAGNSIIRVYWNKLGADQVVLELSDFAQFCDDGILDDVFRTRGFYPVTFKLDDKIKIRRKTFYHCAGLGVKFDLTAVSDNKQAGYVYKELVTEGFMCSSVLKATVKDNVDRMDYWCGVCILQNGIKSIETISGLSDVITNVQRIQDVIYKEFGKSFISFADTKFTVKGGTSAFEDLRTYCVWSSRYKGVFEVYDYEELVSRCADPLFRLMTFSINCNTGVARRFQHYIKYFDVKPDVQKAFIKLCSRLNKFIWDIGKKEGWV